MLKSTGMRLMQAIPTLLFVVTVSFFMIRMAPGGPFSTERSLPEEIEKQILAAYNMDQPLYMQYFDYVVGVLQFDFGPSYKYQDFTVSDLILQGFPASLLVGGLALLLAILIGVPAGSFAAFHRNTFYDSAIMGVSMIGIAIPYFVIAPILMLILGLYLGWLPIGGWKEGEWTDLILPVFSLSLPQIGYIARLTRSGMIETLNSDFIKTAYAKGLPDRLVIFRHAIRPAILPVVSYLGPAATYLLTGSIVIESIFGIPGIGRYFIQSALNRDYTMVMGCVIVFSVLIVVANLIVDVLYMFLDPKLRQI